jgi:hypothetical protein
MKNVFKGLALTSLLTVSSIVSATGWNLSGGYSNFMVDDDDVDTSLGIVYGGVGYTYESGNMSFMPELRLGMGIGNDNVESFGVDIYLEIESFVALSIRSQYDVTENFGIFLQPTYGLLEATASAEGISVTEDEWSFGFGGGAAFKISESASIEALYERYDETDVLSLALRLKF